jgi:hypothetical protein
MKPGEVRTFRKGAGNAVVLVVGVWAERAGKNAPIQFHITGTLKFHTTVTNNSESERYHRTLFRNLRKVLLDNNCWPYGDEGGETESRSYG